MRSKNRFAHTIITIFPGYSGLDFKVAYSRSGVEMTENPKSAGTYKVRITRGEDDLFKAVDVTAGLPNGG